MCLLVYLHINETKFQSINRPQNLFDRIQIHGVNDFAYILLIMCSNKATINN